MRYLFMHETGRQFGRYRVQTLLGAGGMGEVYLAEDTRLRRKVALKVLPENIASDKDRLLRFEREAFAASALNHPNILTIYEFAREGETHFLASEFVAGETLRARLDKEKLTVFDALEIALQIASALRAAHEAGIVHRDIKPENLMIRADGYVKVLDFGLAKLLEQTLPDEEAEARMQLQTQAGMVMGTVAYMSPEQARGKTVDARTDIFSFGVVLYEMLTRRQPFTGETVNHTIVAILEKEPPVSDFLKDFPAEVERILRKCLAKNANERYQTAKDLLAELKEFKEELSFQSKLERSKSPNKTAESPTQIIRAAATNETETQNSIAVLPFANMSADAENEYFCDGLAEELLNALAKIEDLRVAARTSAFSFKGKNAEASQIGKTLNVKTILEGSVRRSGNKLRITVQLINAADGYHLWSERYDREMQDIFDVQDEITLAVVDALKLKLFGDEKKDLLKRYTDNTEAYELYLKGLYQSNKYTPEGWRRAIEYFDKAIETEPRYAAAYARKSYCQHYFYYYAVAAPDEIVDRWRTTTEKALELDDDAADAHLSAAKFYFYRRRDWERAEREFKRAIELNPSSADALQFYGMFAASRGRTEDGIREGKKVLELDPLSLPANHHVAWIYWSANRFDDSRRQAERMMEIEPNFFGAYFHKGMADLGQGDAKAAVAAFQKAAALGATTYTLSYLGWAYALAGRREEALTIIDELLEAKKREFTPAINIARVYAGLSETDKTYEWLEKALDEHNGELVYLEAISKTGEGLFWGKDFRADSRFQDLMRRINSPKGSNGKTTNEASEAQTAMLSVEDAAVPQEQCEPSRKTFSDRFKNHKLFFIIGAIIFLLAAIGFGYRYFSNRPTKQIESIAVLPFENKSSDADTDYLSDGLAESLIYRLSQLPNLKVSPTSSVFRYKGKETGAEKVAGELGVDAVMTGRIMQRGDNLTISVNLVDARNNQSLWGEQYERKMSELLATQREIATTIAEKLQLKLTGADARGITKKYTDSNEAYQLYLKGRFHWAKRTKDDILKAVEYYRQAIALDPNFALAYARIAECFANMPAYPYMSPQEAFPQAKAAAQKALEIDPNLAEAHTFWAFYLVAYERNWAEAERSFKRSIELDPNSSAPHFRYGQIYLAPAGRADEAIAAVKRALEIEPLDINMGGTLAWVYLAAKQSDKALEQAKKTYELEPSHPIARFNLGLVYNANRMYREAIDLSQNALQNDPTSQFMLQTGGYAYARTGRRREAEETIKKFNQLAETQAVSRYFVATIYAAMEMRDAAFAELEKAYQERDWFLMRLKVDPFWDGLRDDARFKDLLRRMNLPQ